MSSVVISGDTSGTVTLQAPATAGSTVLTLPATSGTVVTDATTSGISGSAITTGTVGVSVGGTGANTLTANNVILGAGTSAVTFVAPGSSGNVLTSNGTTWTSAAAGGGQLQTQIFSTPGTWTKPSSATQVRVTVIAAGGSFNPGSAARGGLGGVAVAMVPVSAPVAVTVGVCPGAGATGGSSSFGALVSATGGATGPGPGAGVGSPGNGTVTTGTALKTGTFGDAGSPVVGSTFSTIGGINGRLGSGGAGGNTWTTSSDGIAGAASQSPGAPAGIGGAIVVEFVG